MILQDLLKKADAYRDKIQSARPLSKEELKSLDEYFRVDLTYSSNALEGNTLTISETKILLEDGLTVNGKPIKDCYETIGHAEAYDYMLGLARQTDLQITENVIKHLHYLFYRRIDMDNAGKYRTSQVYISGSEYIPPSPEGVPHLMEHFISQWESSRKSLHPIELATMCHKRLVDIHPFLDGNGRTARLLMNIILVNAGYGVVSIPPVLRHDYINTLVISQTEQNTDLFLKLIAECVIETERDYCRLLNISMK